ncbi:phage tail tape measure protein [Mixta calida]|uniref:phage tail tape measure protein n=1 Tax=Mixta calida TaxID=665913 RepID=UPI000EDF0DED|nr:phage tail tape measure protein [Mixta calida]HCW46568.1 phage tail tape measure protein [Erwiniaceae bacterium]
MSNTNLRLQVVLNAVDKITRPFRKAQAGSKELAAALKASKESLKSLNDQAGRIEGFRKTRSQLAVTEKSLAGARKEAAQLAVQFAATNRPTAQQARLLQQARNRVSELQQTYNGLRQSVQRQRDALRAAGINTKQLGEAQRRLKADADAASGSLERQQAQLKRLGEQQRKQAAICERYHRTLEVRDRMAGNGAAMTGAGVGMLYTSRRMVAPGLEFAQGMSKVQALTRLKKDDPALASLREQSRQLGASTAFTANDVAQGQSFYAMAGFNPEQIRAAMPGTLNMSLAGDTDLATTADIGSNILTGFKLQADQMARVGDSLVATFTRSNTNLQMLGETMKYVAPVAATLGVDMETASAAAGKLGDAGIQGSQAGTSLRAILSRLASPPKEAAKALEELKIKTRDAQGNLRPFVDLLSEMYGKTRQMGNARQAALFKHIAGEEAFSGLSVLVEQAGKGQLQKLVADVKAAHGEAGKVAGTMADNLSGDLKSLSSAWEDVGITLSESVDTPLRSITRHVTALTAKVGAWMKQHPQLTGGIVATGLALGTLITVMGAVTLSMAAILGPVAMLRWSFSILGMKSVSALGLLRGALGMVGNGILWLGRLMFANPILAVVGLIAMAALYIWQNWSTLGPKFAALWAVIMRGVSVAWDWIKQAVSGAWDAIKGIFFNYTLPGLVYKNWEAIKAGVTQAWDLIAATVRDKWNSIASGVLSLGGQFKAAGSAIIDNILSGIEEKWQTLKSRLTSLNSYLPDWMKPGTAGGNGAAGKPAPPQKTGFAGLYDSGGFIPSGQFGIVGENGPELVNGPARITSRRRTAALAATAALVMGSAATPAAARPLHPMSLPVTSGATVKAAGAGSSGASPVTIHAPITIVQQPGQSQQDLVEEVMRRLEAKERQAQARARSSYRDRGGFD